MPSDNTEPSKNGLLVDPNPRSDHLVDTTGRFPVLPIRTSAERRALLEVGRLYDADVQDVCGRPGEWVQNPPDFVLGIGGDALAAGRLYAHLTGRNFRFAESGGALHEIEAPAVVVTTFDHVTAELLDVLYSAQSESAPGIICGSRQSDLRQQVLVRAATTALIAPARVTLRLSSARDHDGGQSGATTGHESAPEVRSRLLGDLGVVTLSTHSDGVDAFLGPDLTLCAVRDAPDDTDPDRWPACRVSGHCHRHDAPLEDMRGAKSLLSPSQISAQILVLNVCYGLLLADGPVDARSGIAVQLLSNPSVSCVVTTWGLNFSDGQPPLVLTLDLEDGRPAGLAVADHNRSVTAHGAGAFFCLLGDPRARSAGRRSQSRPTDPVKHVADTTDPPNGHELGELTFSRARLQVAVSRLIRPGSAISSLNSARRHQFESAKRALEAVSRYEELAWTAGHDSHMVDAAARSLRKELIEDIFRRRKLVHDWYAMARIDIVHWTRCRCWACGDVASRATIPLRVAGASARRLLTCPRCGVVEDISESFPLKMHFDVQQGHLQLDIEPPTRHWAGAVHLHSNHAPFCRMSEWPATPDGDAATSIRTPIPWPPGPLRISLVMMRGWSLSSVGREFSAPPARAAATRRRDGQPG